LDRMVEAESRQAARCLWADVASMQYVGQRLADFNGGG
jgi:hypothetical protein